MYGTSYIESCLSLLLHIVSFSVPSVAPQNISASVKMASVHFFWSPLREHEWQGELIQREYKLTRLVIPPRRSPSYLFNLVNTSLLYPHHFNNTVYTNITITFPPLPPHLTQSEANYSCLNAFQVAAVSSRGVGRPSPTICIIVNTQGK